jgi:hypothetical protein
MLDIRCFFTGRPCRRHTLRGHHPPPMPVLGRRAGAAPCQPFGLIA